jgi:hypothetical protein
METWRVAGEYHSADGRGLSPAELSNAIPMLFGTLPTLQPETSLADATEGIDPGREAALEAG